MLANSEGVNTVSKERSAYAGAAENESARVSKEAERVRDDLSSAISGVLAKFGDFSTVTSAA